MMTQFRTLKASVCFTALFFATGAGADVTPTQVWDDWQTNLAIYGKDGVTIGSVDNAGSTLTVNDLMLSMTDETGMTVTAQIAQIIFAETGDGTVAVQMPDSYPITFTTDPDEYLIVDVSQPGMRMIVGGDKARMSYDITADRYAFTVRDIIQDGVSVLDGDLMIALNNMQGIYTVSTDTMRNIAYDVSVASVDLLADIIAPQGAGNMLMSGKIEGLSTTADVAFPLDLDLTNAENMFVDGLDIAGDYSVDTMNFLYDFNVDDLVANGVVSISGTALDIDLDKANLAYSFRNAAFLVDVMTPDLPVPISYSTAGSRFGVQLPVGITDTPNDFAFYMNVTDLKVNDEIWDLGDPQNILPRDPVTVNLDMSGSVKWFFDFLDPEQAVAMNNADVPGELYAVNLNDLLISAAGATVTGAGAFTFDNDDVDTFDGLPRPLGDLKIVIAGANGLIDNLVAMGFLPEDEAGMARLSLGMFARNVGDDQLETTVKINTEGHLIVNGQRMR